MENLLVHQNQIEYIGSFARPAFALWGEGKALLEGMYDAFSQFGVAFADFRIEGVADDPASQTVKLQVGAKGTFRFRFDRVEATMVNLTEGGLKETAALLQRGEDWLRSSIPEFRFTNHLLGYSAHCAIEDGDSESSLGRLQIVQANGVGASRSSGVILHADVPDQNLTVHLTVDHSLTVENGLYLSFLTMLHQDRIDYEEFRAGADTHLRQMLDSLGLNLRNEE